MYKRQQRLLLGWTPSWAKLKEILLDALGTASQRRQAAHAAIKGARQKQDQSPTELLQYMRIQWEELGQDSLEIMAIEFSEALNYDIKSKLLLVPPQSKMTLRQIEELANSLWRESKRSHPSKGNPPKAERDDRRKRDSKPSGDAGKEAKRTKKGRSAPSKTTKSEASTGKPEDVTCWTCEKKGHYASDCPTKKDKPSSTDEKSGKGKGLKK